MSEEIENVLKCLEMDMLDNTQIELLLNYIEKLKKELEYEKELRIRYERRYDLCKESKDKLQKENTELKDENTILEGNKIGYKLAIQELKEKIKEYEIGIVKE